MSGRGTSGGVVFQAEVGAYAAGLLLAERPLSRLGTGLPGTPKKLLFETPSAVDDILIKTDCGKVYVQAKNTVNLSAKPDGELASVAKQFVRQFQAGVIENGARRALSPFHDRLVLAVGNDTVATVRNQLREVLDRNRTGAATAIPGELVFALKVFTGLIETSWLEELGAPISSTDMQSLLAVCSVIVVGDSERQIVEDGLRNVVAVAGIETTLIELLKIWAASASKSGVGGDATAIRLALSGKVRLSEPPSFRNDVRRLTSYSAGIVQKLKRFTEVATPEGNITISRPVADLVIEAARHGSLVITGEPGGGKSGVIYNVAAELGKEGAVVTLTVEANSISLDALRRDIGIEHPLIEVLKQMPQDKPNYLVLDALDAVRGGLAEATYKRLVEEVLAVPCWHVVASVRTFDLRLGKEWRRLFGGTPPSQEHSDRDFAAVRHVHIGLLDAVERADIAVKSPTLSAAIHAGGRKMEALAQNPFNLGLLGELLKEGIQPEALSSVATRGELLERYWEERIIELGTVATVSLKSVVSSMIASRAIDLHETEVPISTAETVDKLLQMGVLVNGGNRRIGFRHHVLFDYAVARLILIPNRISALSLLGKANGAGLLISPSLGYWLEELKRCISPSEFWSFIVALVSNEVIDPIIRVEVARIAVESVQRGDNLNPLAEILNQDDQSLNCGFGHLVGSLLTKASSKQPIETEAWAHLLSKLIPKPEQLGSMRSFIGELLNQENTPEALDSLGIASRTLFDAMSRNENLIAWLAPHVVPYIAQTYGTNPAASRQKLNEIFTPERFSRLGHVEVPWLAREVMMLAEHDGDFVVQLFYRVFLGGDFSRDQVTSMSRSWILSFTSNAAQDFSMAEYSLTSAFPGLIEKFPRTAIRALATTLRAQSEKRSPAKDAYQIGRLPIGNTVRGFIEDRSYFWAGDIDNNQYDNYAKLYQSFVEWVQTFDDQQLLEEIPELILRETEISLAWRTLFVAAVRKPQSLGKLLWRSAADASALNALDTRESAIAAVAATYPFLSQSEREEAEAEWLQHDHSKFETPNRARLQIIGALFEFIGETQLATEAARVFLRQARTDGSTLENQKSFEVHNSGSVAANWQGVEEANATSVEVATLLTLNNKVVAANDVLTNEATKEHGVELWEATLALDKATVDLSGGIDGSVDNKVCATLAEGLGLVLAQGHVPEDVRQTALARLLELSHHSEPQSTGDTEKNFARHQSWGSPAPRIEAANALSMIARIPEFWPQIGERYEAMLLDDPHPAVRLQLVRSIPLIGRIDIETMWHLAERFAHKEQNSGVIRYGAHALSTLCSSDSERLEPLAIELSERVGSPERGDDAITGMIAYFAMNKNLAASRAVMYGWLENYLAKESRLHSTLFILRNKMVLGIENSDQATEQVRRRVQEFLWSFVSVVEPAVRSWPASSGPPTAGEEAALKLFNEIANQIYYAVGHDVLVPNLTTNGAKRRFLIEYAPLFSKLTTLGTPRSVHLLLEVLSKLINADPKLCFDLFSEAILRTTGVARYEHESMGASLFVQLVGLYLADHRTIFTDETRREKLMDCLAIFVEAGWPEARKLFQSLPELLQ